MFVNNIQERVERSLFEIMRKLIVAQGYLPDITNAGRYPTSSGNFTNIAQFNWEADIDTIIASKGWVVEIFGTSSLLEKGLKRIPRVVIVPKRILDGEIGVPPGSWYLKTEDGLTYKKSLYIDDPANLQYDIHLISSSQKQSRFLNLLLSTVIGSKRYIQFYDNVNERFFIKSYNYYEISDSRDGEEENVYSFEVRDIYLFEDPTPVDIKPISEITAEVIPGYMVDENGVITGDNGVVNIVIGDINTSPVDTEVIESEVVGEVPAGAINSSNAIFTTEFDFVPETLEVFLNGLLQRNGTHYNTSGTKTILLSDSPVPPDTVEVNYDKKLN